jgi:hypothetical protein
MTRNFDSIIEFENESSGVDFKAIQYDKKKHDLLIKDIIAMANADIEGERLIIIGIKHKPDGSREIQPIDKDSFVDSSVYQQLIRENIEPELSIEYTPYIFNNKLLGLFKINNCNDRPYMLKKDYGKLQKGDCFIRKGSHQFRASRSDLDKIYSNKKEEKDFTNNLLIGFSNTNFSQTIKLSPINSIGLPSKMAENEIKKILHEKQEEYRKLDPSQRLLKELNENNFFHRTFFGGVPYEKRSISTLKENLKEVENTYKEDDIYEIQEKRSFHMNFDIFNNSNEYIYDASTIVEVDDSESYEISPHLPSKPKDDFLLSSIPSLNHRWQLYPTVKNYDGKIIISSQIGEIKHQLVTKLFQEDLRFVLYTIPQKREMEILIKIYGKNISMPIEKKLTIICE